MQVTGKNLNLLNQWLNDDHTNKCTDLLQEHGFISLDMPVEEKAELKNLILECQNVKAPLRAMKAPEIMNIELTTRCPLRCPQCYCDLNQGQDIKKEVALKYLEEAVRLKIPLSI